MQMLEAHVSFDVPNIDQSVEPWLLLSAEKLRLEAHR
jgi:hypothetical protein